MTDEIRAWRETLTTLETELVYYEATVRKKGKARTDAEYAKARLAAVTCARDAVSRKLAKMLEADSTPTP